MSADPQSDDLSASRLSGTWVADHFDDTACGDHGWLVSGASSELQASHEVVATLARYVSPSSGRAVTVSIDTTNLVPGSFAVQMSSHAGDVQFAVTCHCGTERTWVQSIAPDAEHIVIAPPPCPHCQAE